MSTTYLVHSAKGQTWKNHKYIAIKNGHYIYSNDSAGEGSARQLKREAREEQRKVEANLAKRGIDVAGMQANRTTSKNGIVRKDDVRAYTYDRPGAGKEANQRNADIASRALTKPVTHRLDAMQMEKHRKQQNEAIRRQRAAEDSKRQSEANIENSRGKFIENKQKKEKEIAKRQQAAEVSKRQSEANIEKSRDKFKPSTNESNADKSYDKYEKMFEEILDDVLAKRKTVKDIHKKFGIFGKSFLASIFGWNK